MTEAARLRELARVPRRLRDSASTEELLAAAAGAACETCGFTRGLVLTVAGARLTAEDSGALADRESDLLRRAVLADALALDPDTVEAAAAGGGPARAASSGRSVLAERLGLAQAVLAPVAPDPTPVAVLVLDRPAPPVQEADLAAAEVFSSFLAVALELVVRRRSVAELAGEVRRLNASTDALAREVLTAPVTLPAAAAAAPLVRFDVDPGAAGGLRQVLSEAEQRVAALLAQGRSNPQIAEELFLSPETVKTHVARILRKVGAANRAEAVYRLARLGSD
ncbi:MAG TPA: LuxR C-terminal-related transcriptional regulator [Baekduia sp.]|nr:LuxR C-terminal-related transcriptional regulator [Baekduia sp.]